MSLPLNFDRCRRRPESRVRPERADCTARTAAASSGAASASRIRRSPRPRSLRSPSLNDEHKNGESEEWRSGKVRESTRFTNRSAQAHVSNMIRSIATILEPNDGVNIIFDYVRKSADFLNALT